MAVLAIGGVCSGGHGGAGDRGGSAPAGTAVLAIGGVCFGGDGGAGEGGPELSVCFVNTNSWWEKPAGIPSTLSRNITRKGQKFPLVWNIEEG
jgi:hypothetical protein